MDRFEVINTYLLATGVTSSKILKEMWEWYARSRKVPLSELKANVENTDFFRSIVELARKDKTSNHIIEVLKENCVWMPKAEAYFKDIQRKWKVISFTDSDYPHILSHVSDAPAMLYYNGEIQLLASILTVAVVGTRIPSEYGVRVGKDFISQLVESNVVPVSGYAKGIDSLVWAIAEQRGKPHIDVVPHCEHPIHKMKNGLAVSEYPRGIARKHKWQFIERNRIIAGLSKCTLVIEAPIKSGALATAQFSDSYGRGVYFAPHEIYSKGIGGMKMLPLLGDARIISSLAELFFYENLGSNYKTFATRIIEKIAYALGIFSTENSISKINTSYGLIFYECNKIIRNLIGGTLDDFEKGVVELLERNLVISVKGKLYFNLEEIFK